jgi:hypothetical protein
LILISHRGNISGPHPEDENSPPYIVKALDMGYQVEIDVWFLDGVYYLGHDEPQYKIRESFLMNNNFWCHAKNLEALNRLLKLDVNCFWHENDDFTLTSNKKIWTYPNKQVNENSVIVCKNIEETIKYSNMQIFGICSDFVGDLK